MTQQMSDGVTYRRPWSLRKRMFALAATNGTGLFDPTEHGMTPIGACTGLYRGFLCEYKVDRDRLLLRDLYIFLEDWEPEFCERFPEHDPDFLSWSIYRDLRIPVSFTGGMLLGHGFVNELWWRAGYMTPAWLYYTVHELVFEKGHLVQATNRSREIAQYRAEFADKPILPDLDDHPDWISWHRENYTMRLTHDYEG